MVECCTVKDENAVLFDFTECLFQLTEHFKNQNEPLPSNKELLRLFKIALNNCAEALDEYRK